MKYCMPTVCSFFFFQAEDGIRDYKVNESELSANAQAKPSRATANPASMEPAVSVPHWVVCVSDLAVCNSAGLAIAGRIAARPLVKNGETNISSPLNSLSFIF